MDFETIIENELTRLKDEAEKVVNSNLVHNTVGVLIADLVELVESMVKGPPEPVNAGQSELVDTAQQPPPPEKL